MKLEFGNLEHIKRLQAGIMCVCGHGKLAHNDYIGLTGCGGKGSEEKWMECEYDYPDCECDGFEEDKDLEFDISTNLFIKK